MMFGKRLILLLFISILLGTAVSGIVAEVANGYFHNTMDSLVGAYGEYDFIVQVREEQKENAKPILESVLVQHFAGGHYQEAPVIGGRANFFVAIPDDKKSKAVYERIDSYFAVLPGAAGLSIISEPRLSIRGVPQGAIELLSRELEKMEGVRFVFLDGPTIHVMIADMERSRQIEEEVKQLLASYRVIEIRFPTGAEIASPVRQGEELARRLQQKCGLDFARYVSIDETRGEEVRLSATLTEMKAFLKEYQSTVTIALDEGQSLSVGDLVAVRPAATDEGDSTQRETVTVKITHLKAREAVGVITAGDAASFGQDDRAYRIDENMAYTLVGRAFVDSPRSRLTETIQKIAQLGALLPASGQDVSSLMREAESMLTDYDAKLAALKQTASEMEALSRTIGEASGEAAGADTTKLRSDLSQAIASVNNVGRWLNLVAWASRDVREAKASLAEVEKYMVTVNTYLEDFAAHTEEAKRAEDFFMQMTENTRRTSEVLQSFDAERVQASLRQAERGIRSLAEADITSLTAQMKAVAGTLPSLRDDDIYETVQMLDRLIEGHLIPNKRIQLLTTQQLTADMAKPIIFETIGHENAAVSESDLGIIEPNTYLEVYRMLREVKRVLAGMTAMVLTVLFLVLDHTAVLSMMKLRHRHKCGRRGGGNVFLRIRQLFQPAHGYSMAVGALLLTSIFCLSGGGIPYLPAVSIPIIGAVFGLIVSGYAERISPVSESEIMAGESLGMTDGEILREIVIPSARPGLLLLLNRRSLRFR